MWSTEDYCTIKKEKVITTQHSFCSFQADRIREVHNLTLKVISRLFFAFYYLKNNKRPARENCNSHVDIEFRSFFFREKKRPLGLGWLGQKGSTPRLGNWRSSWIGSILAYFPWFTKARWWAIRSSTTAGSARVEMSPRSSAWSAATLRKIRRIILPDRVFGKPPQNCLTLGLSVFSNKISATKKYKLSVDYLYDIRKGISGNFLPNYSTKFRFHLTIGLNTILQDNVSIDSFSFNVVRVSDNGWFCYRQMLSLPKSRRSQITHVETLVWPFFAVHQNLLERFQLQQFRVDVH